jgi:hypothetical protein
LLAKFNLNKLYRINIIMIIKVIPKTTSSSGSKMYGKYRFYIFQIEKNIRGLTSC